MHSKYLAKQDLNRTDTTMGVSDVIGFVSVLNAVTVMMLGHSSANCLAAKLQIMQALAPAPDYTCQL